MSISSSCCLKSNPTPWSIVMTQRRISIRTLQLAAGLVLAMTHLIPAQGRPSDIDVYTHAPATSDVPNVLFLLDSSANWSTAISGAANCYYNEAGVPTSSGPVDQGTKLAIEQCALHNLIDGLNTESGAGPDADQKFNVGLMLMNESSANGMYPRNSLVPLTTNNKVKLKALIRSLTKNGDKATNADYGLGMYEAYLYFKGMTPLHGKATSKFDAASFNSANKYISPAANSCARNYVIVIGNGSPQNSNPEKEVQSLMNARIDADLSSYTTAQRTSLKIKISDSALGNDEANWSDEMARFASRIDVSSRDSAQGIITSAIAVKKGPSDGNFPALMESIAFAGGGSYYEATNANALLESLKKIFNQMQATNSVFTSASLPVAVNARGTYLNQVFMGMFRPDKDASPRWRGNLKQYKFGMDNRGNLFLSDALDNGAISSTTGFFKPEARSYWTSTSTYWSKEPMGTPASESDAPDGEVVEKGGVSQRLRSISNLANRKVFTCVSCAGNTTLGADVTTRFEKANSSITAAMLGQDNDEKREVVIKHARGEITHDDEKQKVPDGTVVRPSVHGDVLHSRPAVLNFGGSTGVVVFYGSNDGHFRAVNGNQTGTGAGEELWSFIAEEHYKMLERMQLNTPEIRVTGTPLNVTAEARNYAMDGPIGTYLKRTSTGAVDKAAIFVGMRRGGRAIYAFDVSTPSSPKFMWKVDHTSTGMSSLGQTWSEPRVARVKGQTDPVLIFGGGYDDSAEDVGSTTYMGNAVFVLNARTGALIRKFHRLEDSGEISRSVPADISLMDSDADGVIDRAYAVDLGGQVYRIDFEQADGDHEPDDWTIYALANLSGGTSTGRKFFYAPDLVKTRDFVAVLVGSGDREKPLLSNTADHFIQLFDRRRSKGAPRSVSPITWGDLSPMTETGFVSGAGCYLALEQGEKVVNGAVSSVGQVFFGTNRPKSSAVGSASCSANLGVARSYGMPLFCTSATGLELASGGLPPSPVAGVVEVPRPGGGTEQVPFVIGAPNSNGSAIEASRVRSSINSPRQRRYWFQETRR